VQLELPANFVPKGDPEYIPPVSHDTAEAERRRNLPPNTLVLEQQYLGAVAAGLFVQELIENGSHEDIVFGSNVLSAAMLGSARFSLRGGRPVMRRHLHLPIMADPDTDIRTTQQGRNEITLDELELTTGLSKEVYERNRETGRVALGLSHRFGHEAGDAALWVAMLPHDEIGATGTTTEVQEAVMQVGMNALENTRRLSRKVGQNLSLAMLGTPGTKLAPYLEEKAPHGAYNALRDAQSEARKIADIE
jgi:hypothetical protein